MMNQKHLTRLFVIAAMIVSLLVIGSAAGTLTEGQQIRGDCNGDGAINMKDVLILRKYIADLPVEFADHICSVSPSETQPTAPSYTQPSETQPSYTQPSETQPSYTQPSETQPSYTQPSETQPSETQPSYTQPSETQPSQTQPSQSQPQGDTYTLSLNISEEAPRYNTVTHTDSFQVPKNQDATIEIVVMAYQDLDVNDTAKIKGFVSLTGATLSGDPVIGDIEDHKYPITFTYKVSMDSDKTVSGTIASPIFEASSISVNGQGGTTPTQGSEASQSGGTTQPSSAPIVVEGDANIDLVTLTFNDMTASDYGVSFHSFSALSSPVVQIVDGEVSEPTAFATANEVAASSKTQTSMNEWEAYNPLTYEFNYKWESRATMNSPTTTYVHQAVLKNLAYNTIYSYRVGDKTTGAWSPIYTFKTRPESVGDFSFIFTADTQPDLGDKKAYAGMNMLFNKAFGVAPNAAFLMSGGDFIYCSDEGMSGISQWRNVINGCNNFNVDSSNVAGAAGSLFAEHPWMVANGNHDNGYVQDFFKNTPAVSGLDTYSFDYGNVHIAVLDTGKNGVVSNQTTWLDNDLKSTTKKFKMVFLHFSIYCHEERDVDAGDGRATLISVLENNNVDFVVSAHVNEDYYTTYPLKGGAVATTSYTTEGDVKYFQSGSGPIYLQNAGSGLDSSYSQKGKTGVMFKGKNDGGLTCSYPDLMLHTAMAGYEASFMTVDVTSNKLTVNRYYLDSSLNAARYNVGQVGVIKN